MSKRISESANAAYRSVAKLSLMLPFLSLCVGCVHRPIQTKATYSLEKTSEYPLLVPSIQPEISNEDFQTVHMALSGKAGKRVSNSELCAIKGSIFSLHPDLASASDQWLITSPSVQGWEKHGGEIDLTTEWDRFTSALLLREKSGCFPPTKNLSSITREIAAKIPLPASGALLFFYSFSGNRSFVDLVPGMQITVEQTLVESKNGEQTIPSNPSSLEAEYEIVPLTATGVTLHLLKTANRRPPKNLIAKESLVFNLSARFATSPLLRLLLETVGGDNKKRSSVLIGASNVSDLDVATRQIEEDSAGECPASLTAVNCVSFGKETAVSLLSSLWVNGRRSYRPVGTTLGYMIDILPKDKKARALATISLKRPLPTGGYAEVTFPKTTEDAQQIILLSGDRLTWRH
jgi:hypothetical protein